MKKVDGPGKITFYNTVRQVVNYAGCGLGVVRAVVILSISQALCLETESRAESWDGESIMNGGGGGGQQTIWRHMLITHP